MTLPVSERFLSIQGEGPRAGRVCFFVRLGGCNLSCSWCDTPYTWDSSRYDLRHELVPTEPEEIIDSVPDDVQEVVITGGEPLMHQRRAAWVALLRGLYTSGRFIAVETNGTIVPDYNTQHFVQHYSISPKLPNAGEHKRRQNPAMQLWPEHLRRNGTAILKFVVQDAKDVQLAVDLAASNGWERDKVWVMPEGIDEATVLNRWPEIATEAIMLRVNATMRLQILAFGDSRGT